MGAKSRLMCLYTFQKSWKIISFVNLYHRCTNLLVDSIKEPIRINRNTDLRNKLLPFLKHRDDKANWVHYRYKLFFYNLRHFSCKWYFWVFFYCCSLDEQSLNAFCKLIIEDKLIAESVFFLKEIIFII